MRRNAKGATDGWRWELTAEATTRYVWQDSPSSSPSFADWTSGARDIQAAAGDFRLWPESPCINAGSNELVSGDMDRPAIHGSETAGELLLVP